MKKIIGLVAIVFLLTGFAGCKNGGGDDDADCESFETDLREQEYQDGEYEASSLGFYEWV